MRISTILAACSVFFVSACVTGGALVGGAADVFDKKDTPRNAAVQVADPLANALNEFAGLCEIGAFSPELASTIIEHGPVVVDTATEYFESAEYCVVIDGELLDVVGAGRPCQRGTVARVATRFPAVLMQSARELGYGTEAGLLLYGAGKLVDRFTASYRGDPDGEFLVNDTLNRAAYIKRLEGLRLARDRLKACVMDVADQARMPEASATE